MTDDERARYRAEFDYQKKIEDRLKELEADRDEMKAKLAKYDAHILKAVLAVVGGAFLVLMKPLSIFWDGIGK